jgi:hypothetical protein
MVHLPKSIYGVGLLLLVTLGVLGVAAQVAAAVPAPLLAASAAAVAVPTVALIVWRHAVEARRERAWVGEFSFGDVIARMRAREALAPQ